MTEKMVPASQAARMLTTGFEWEAGLFIETYKILCEKLGRDEARKIMGKAMYNAGLQLGKDAREFTDYFDPEGMAQTWDVIYGMGTKEADIINEERFTITGYSCGAYNLFKRWGIPEEEIRFFADSYCAGDVGHAQGFGGGCLFFQHKKRLMHGDDRCIWDFSSDPQEPSPSRTIIDED